MTNQRYYTAIAGRFYTPDPLGLAAVENPTGKTGRENLVIKPAKTW